MIDWGNFVVEFCRGRVCVLVSRDLLSPVVSSLGVMGSEYARTKHAWFAFMVTRVCRFWAHSLTVYKAALG